MMPGLSLHHPIEGSFLCPTFWASIFFLLGVLSLFGSFEGGAIHDVRHFFKKRNGPLNFLDFCFCSCRLSRLFCFDFHFFLSKKFSNWVGSLVSCCSFKNLFLSSSFFRFSLSFEALKVVGLARFKKIFTLWRFPLNYIDADSIGPTIRFFEGFWEKYFSLKLYLKNLHTVNVFIFSLF